VKPTGPVTDPTQPSLHPGRGGAQLRAAESEIGTTRQLREEGKRQNSNRHM